MTREQLIVKFPHASQSFLEANLTGAVAGLESPVAQPNPVAALARSPLQRKGRKSRVAICVTLIACRKRLLDSDNNISSGKPLRDHIAASFQTNDADPRIEWRYEQIRAQQEGVIVLIQASL